MSMMFDLLNGHSNVSDFTNLVSKARTTRYLKKASEYRGHVDYWCKRNAHAFSGSSPIVMDDFPTFFSHCNGYNMSLGPSNQFCSTLFADLVAQQTPFFQRYQGGILAINALQADHHHNVPGRIKITDPQVGMKYSPIDGIFAAMDDRQFIVSHIFTASTTMNERRQLAIDLRKRYEDRGIDVDKLELLVYFDKCCEDASWFLELFPMAIVLIDNHHLIARYVVLYEMIVGTNLTVYCIVDIVTLRMVPIKPVKVE